MPLNRQRITVLGMENRHLKYRFAASFAILTISALSTLGASLAYAKATIQIDPRQLNRDSIKVWIFFTDRGESINRPAKFVAVSQPAITRRALRANIVGATEYDRELNPDYLAAIQPLVQSTVQQSRWLNAISAYVDPSKLDQLSQQPCIAQIRSVATFKRSADLVDQGVIEKPLGPFPPEYGPSWAQMNQIQIPALHDLGYKGAGIRILMMDTGFRIDHPVFANTDIEATYDFINHDNDVQDDNQEPVQQSHGTQTFSVVGASVENLMLGAAYEATFLLAKTEIFTDEIQIEEDNWVAGIEWGEGLGCDVVSSSLGYTEWYSYSDMDGNTAVTTKAADIAASLGVIVVNSIGNEQSQGNSGATLIAPSDGDSVIAAGGVNISGDIAVFSSHGPSFDGRIKPDLCALGVGNAVANPVGNGLATNSGTSFSCPLIASAVALLLQAEPDWGFGQIYTALTTTATRANNPDNIFGYGIVRAFDALNYENHQSKNLVGVVAYPNPFNQVVKFDFEVPPAGVVEIRIYTIAGEKIVTLIRPAGDPAPIEWNGKNQAGEEAASGVYIAYISADGVSETKKIFKHKELVDSPD